MLLKNSEPFNDLILQARNRENISIGLERNLSKQKQVVLQLTQETTF